MSVNVPTKTVELALDGIGTFRRISSESPLAFLAGPYIEIENEPSSDEYFSAKRLRFYLYHRFTKVGWNMSLGEYQKLIDKSDMKFGKHSNTLIAERDHVKDKGVHAVIMLPSSPGSFLELGSFCSDDEICSKMLIVVDECYKCQKSFLSTGPLKEAERRGTSITYIKYTDLDYCAKVVSDFVTDKWEIYRINTEVY